MGEMKYSTYHSQKTKTWQICFKLFVFLWQERSKLAQQLCRLYGVNKKADVPAHVYFAGFDKNGELYQECIRKIDGFEKYQARHHDFFFGFLWVFQ